MLFEETLLDAETVPKYVITGGFCMFK